jgi:subtilisin family serine protease
MRYNTDNKIRIQFVLFILLCFSLVALSAQEMISGKQIRIGMWENQQVEYLESEIAIILKPGISQADVLPLIQGHGANIRQNFDKLGWGLIELPKGVDVLSLAATLKKNPLIEAAEPNMVDRPYFEPNDTFYQDGHQWALKNTGQNPPGGTTDADIDAPEAWNITRGSSSIIIAILDSGIPMVNGSLSHPDLNNASKFILGPDYIDPNGANGVRDGYGHGTHVTGIAAAETNNSTGIAGVCENCRVMVIQVFADPGGGGSHTAFRSGVIYAVDHGANVINYSGGGSASSTKEQGVQYAYNNSVLIVSASGNNNGSIIWPAAYSSSYSNVIAVGSTQYNDARASYSNYGSQLNVVAPGGAHDGGYPVDSGDIYSTMPSYTVTLNGSPYYVAEDYGYLPGTSMAAPHVSGVAALMLSISPNLTPAAIRIGIENTADKVPGMGGQNFTNYYGWGRVNAYEAVNEVPKPPTNLYISGYQGGMPRINWTASTSPDIDYYELWWQQYYPPQGWQLLTTTSATSWVDSRVTIDLYGPEDTYCYKALAVDNDGLKSDFSNSDCILVDESPPWGKSGPDNTEMAIPEMYSLGPNFPNPFNPTTTIRYELPEDSFTELRIYDLMGREIRTLVNGNETAGYKNVLWDGKDMFDNPVSSGMYVYKISARSLEGNLQFSQTRKMILLR